MKCVLRALVQLYVAFQYALVALSAVHVSYGVIAPPVLSKPRSHEIVAFAPSHVAFTVVVELAMYGIVALAQ